MFYFSIKENWINNDDGVYLRNVHIHPLPELSEFPSHFDYFVILHKIP